jgi:hypothetical protein
MPGGSKLWCSPGVNIPQSRDLVPLTSVTLTSTTVAGRTVTSASPARGHASEADQNAALILSSCSLLIAGVSPRFCQRFRFAACGMGQKVLMVSSAYSYK